MTIRRVVFWGHMLTGVAAGAVVFVMAVTGALLAFEPQLVAFSERHLRSVPPPPTDARRQRLDVILASVRAASPEATPARVLLHAERTASLVVSLGADTAVFVDPYTARVLGPLSPLHRAMQAVVGWHRWLGTRDLGRPITSACNLAFLGLAVTGVSLWWPRVWSRPAVAAVTVPDLRLHGKARDFNWHTVTGFWCASVIVVLTLTGAVISYPWANDLLFRLTGSTPPPRVVGDAGAPRGERRSGRTVAVSPDLLDVAAAFADRHAPGWASMSLRLPARPGAAVTISIEEASSWRPAARSHVTLDATTAALERWEPFAEASPGRTLRSWVRPLHTGEAFGVVGQLVAGLASAGGAILVWTGLALAWRRVRAWSARARRSTGSEPGDVEALAP